MNTRNQYQCSHLFCLSISSAIAFIETPSEPTQGLSSVLSSTYTYFVEAIIKEIQIKMNKYPFMDYYYLMFKSFGGDLIYQFCRSMYVVSIKEKSQGSKNNRGTGPREGGTLASARGRKVQRGWKTAAAIKGGKNKASRLYRKWYRKTIMIDEWNKVMLF